MSSPGDCPFTTWGPSPTLSHQAYNARTPQSNNQEDGNTAPPINRQATCAVIPGPIKKKIEVYQLCLALHNPMGLAYQVLPSWDFPGKVLQVRLPFLSRNLLELNQVFTIVGRRFYYLSPFSAHESASGYAP